jgi:hypothetical protein
MRIRLLACVRPRFAHKPPHDVGIVIRGTSSSRARTLFVHAERRRSNVLAGGRLAVKSELCVIPVLEFRWTSSGRCSKPCPEIRCGFHACETA